MSFMIWIIEELIAIQEFFYDAYQEVKDSVWPFYLLKYPLYGLYGSFYWLQDAFYEFYQWLLWAEEKLEETFSWSYIQSLIRSWLYGIENALDWFGNWTYWVRQQIDEWWQPILLYVLDYIDLAVEGLDTIIVSWDSFWTVTWPGLLNNLEELQGNWSNFWSVTFPTLVSFDWLSIWWQSRLYDIQALIDTALQEFSGTLEGWQEIRDSVFEFFNDPWAWLEQRFANWFLGGE